MTMPLSTLLACLSVGRSNADMLAVVADVALRFGARVVGVAARQVSAHPYVRGAGPVEPRDYDGRRFNEQAARAEQEFFAALSQAAALEWRAQMTVGPASEFVAREARSADLVVAPLDRGERAIVPSGRPDAGALMMRLGRPLLTAPAGATGLAFRSALVCFKDTREARRALADSLPLLQAMERVHVAEVTEAGAAADAARRLRDVAGWLASHGVEASFDAIPAGEIAAAGRLAAIARDLDADLIVAGAFGHSRLSEWALGGVTRDLLLRGDRCALSSH